MLKFAEELRKIAPVNSGDKIALRMDSVPAVVSQESDVRMTMQDMVIAERVVTKLEFGHSYLIAEQDMSNVDARLYMHRASQKAIMHAMYGDVRERLRELLFVASDIRDLEVRRKIMTKLAELVDEMQGV